MLQHRQVLPTPVGQITVDSGQWRNNRLIHADDTSNSAQLYVKHTNAWTTSNSVSNIYISMQAQTCSFKLSVFLSPRFVRETESAEDNSPVTHIWAWHRQTGRDPLLHRGAFLTPTPLQEERKNWSSQDQKLSEKTTTQGKNFFISPPASLFLHFHCSFTYQDATVRACLSSCRIGFSCVLTLTHIKTNMKVTRLRKTSDCLISSVIQIMCFLFNWNACRVIKPVRRLLSA